MPMMKSVAAENPEAYVISLSGWRQRYVQALRSAVLDATALQEVIKWGHLVYFSNGPVLLIRAEENRVLFGFWRGKHLRDIEPRLKPGGKYEMATLEVVESTPLRAFNSNGAGYESSGSQCFLGQSNSDTLLKQRRFIAEALDGFLRFAQVAHDI